MCGLQVSLTIIVAAFTTQSLYLRLMRFNSAPRLMKSVYVFDFPAYGRPALAPSLFLSDPHSCLRGFAAVSLRRKRSRSTSGTPGQSPIPHANHNSFVSGASCCGCGSVTGNSSFVSGVSCCTEEPPLRVHRGRRFCLKPIIIRHSCLSCV